MNAQSLRLHRAKRPTNKVYSSLLGEL